MAPVLEVDPHAEEATIGVARGHEQEVARHAQVHDEVDFVGQLADQVLAAARERLDPASLDRLRHLLGRRGLAPARIEDLDTLDRPSDHRRLELAPDRLDLGQLGHQEGGRGAKRNVRRSGSNTCVSATRNCAGGASASKTYSAAR